jgi:hypothetical protein
MMVLYVSAVIGLVCFILYVLDRRGKGEPLDWGTATKISTFGSLISGGITYVVSAPETVEVLNVIEPVQEMFVGIPTF